MIVIKVRAKVRVRVKAKAETEGENNDIGITRIAEFFYIFEDKNRSKI